MHNLNVGATLRQERLRQGLSLKDVAAQTRISADFLGAIEAGDFQRLPGLLFTRSFVRQFAQRLGMDAEPILANLPKIENETAPFPDVAVIARPGRMSPRWAATVSSIMWIALASGVSTGAYLYFRPRQAPPVNNNNHAQVQYRVAPAPTLVPLPPTYEAPAPAAVTKHGVEVVLTAHEASWVRISADGRTAFTGILHTNDSRTVAADELVKVTAGNAGGVEISLNGKSLEAMGPVGQVRTVLLTADAPPSLEPH